MISPIPRVLSWSRRHPSLVALFALALGALSAFGATRLTFDTDILSLLPRTGRAIPAFRTFVEVFGSLDELYVVFTAPEGHAIPDYTTEIDTWTARLRAAPEVARVDSGLMDPSRNLEWLAKRQLLLMSADTLQLALSRFQDAGMRSALADRRELLAVPSDAAADLVRHDPLGLSELLRDQLGGSKAAVNIGATEGGYTTPDSRSRLLVVHPARPPYDTAFSHALLAVLDRIRADMESPKTASTDNDGLPPLQVQFAGGHCIAVETEAVVRRESVTNTLVSLGLILPLLFVVFRSFWLVLVGPLPAAISLAIVLGLLGLAGSTLSAAATASAAMLFGLGVDGVVLLYVVHTLALRQHENASHGAAHLAGPSTSMLLGMWTTAATFYGLAVVDFPSLEQLGLLIGHSMALCGILTLVLVPALLPRRVEAARAPLPVMPGLATWVQRHRRSILVIAAGMTVALGAAALKVRVNPTLERLRSVTPAAAALERIARQFGLPRDVYVILQRGSDLDALLMANERLSARAARALPSVSLQAASALLPSESTQKQRADAIGHARLQPDAVAAALETAALAEGFKPDAFAPFRNRLADVLSTGPRVTHEAYVQNGLGDLIGRFVRTNKGEWLVASYAFPSSDIEVSELERLVADTQKGGTLTGLALVNAELAERFLPQFLRGLAAGSVVVLLLIAGVFRDWRLSLLALAPAVIGLVWAAGLLALAGIELDLFAVFAVVTFVGIGVDYGVHLVHRYRDHGDARLATEELAPVILVAAAITLLGYGTLVISGYPPLRSIGIVSVVAVAALAPASVLLLPALLSRPQDKSLDKAPATCRNA